MNTTTYTADVRSRPEGPSGDGSQRPVTAIAVGPVSRGTALARTFRAEWTKLRTLRSTWITVGVSVAVSIGFALLNATSTVSEWADMSPKQRAEFDPTSSSLIGVLFAALIFGSLAVRTMTSEYSSGMIRVTFAAIAQRRRVIAAKASLIATIGFTVALASNLLAYFPSQQILRSKHIESSINDSGVVAALVLGAVSVAVVAVIGVGLGTILRRTALAITTLSLAIIGGQIVGLALPESARTYLPSSALQATVSVHRAADLLSAGRAVIVIVLYAAACYAAANLLVSRRDA
ncbi:MAG: transporter permease [Acidimicrobiales bacterium]|nr:transporter permease [Acidimicrobiales bacterium]